MTKPIQKMAKKPLSQPKSLSKPVSKPKTNNVEGGKKFDQGKTMYSISPMSIRAFLTPVHKECCGYDIKLLNGVSEEHALDWCIRQAISCYYNEDFAASLIWICRYFLIIDNGFDDVEDIRYPLLGLERAVKIMEHGAVKYGRDNWQILPEFYDRYISAGDRHLGPFLANQTIDPDSGMEHLAHWQCNVMFLAWKQRKDGLVKVTTSQ